MKLSIGSDIDDPGSINYRWALTWLTLLAYNKGQGSICGPPDSYLENWWYDDRSVSKCTDFSDPCNPGCHAPKGCEWWISCTFDPAFQNDWDPTLCGGLGGWWVHDLSDPCCTHDFIKYVNECKDPAFTTPPPGCSVEVYGNPYAAQVIAKYGKILKTCPSICKDGVPIPPNFGGSTGTPSGGALDCATIPPATVCTSLFQPGTLPPVAGGASCSINTGTNGGAFCAWRPNPNPHNHNGVDIRRPGENPSEVPPDFSASDTIQAVQAGTVTFAGWDGAYGNRVEILHGDGCISSYSHLESFSVTAGQIVAAGQPIGIMDDTGYSLGKHLHFSIMGNTGKYVNPADVPAICTWTHS